MKKNITGFSTTGVVVATILLSGVVLAAFDAIFDIPSQPELITLENNALKHEARCIESVSTPIDRNGELNLLVWNVYKQNKPNLPSELFELASDRQLVLLQEVSLTESMKAWLEANAPYSALVNAFKAQDNHAGVMTYAVQPPEKACAYVQVEPWLRLPKSALLSKYKLSNGESLLVANIHSINFTIGTEDYKQQVSAIKQAFEAHTGPMIFAGDFNSWSEARLEVLGEELERLGMERVTYSPDHRTRFITGLALDQIFYRGLTLEKAKAPQSDASDHNPLLASFRLVTKRD